MKNFVYACVERGGSLKSLIVDSSHTNGTGLFNPSVFYDKENDKLLINIRHCQYTLYHSEKNVYEYHWGPLLYLNPENDITLTTTNFFGELNDDLSIKYINKVDTSNLDKKPLWQFVGLEDARLVKWHDKYYLIGVRRDTTTNGEGRMESSRIEWGKDWCREVSRTRFPAPDPNTSYCEKNWMPILDQPGKFVKWANPIEIVNCYSNGNEVQTETTILKSSQNFDWDQRGGGQVIPWEDGYLMLTHETNLFQSEAGRKNATYRHRFSYWTKDFELISKSDRFDFMGAKIEFACGLAEYKDKILVSFGFQDNAAFIVSCPNNYMKEIMNV